MDAGQLRERYRPELFVERGELAARSDLPHVADGDGGQVNGETPQQDVSACRDFDAAPDGRAEGQSRCR